MREPTVIFATDLEHGVAEGVRLATRLAVQHAATLLFVHVAPVRRSDGEAMLYSAVDLSTGDATRRLQELVPTDPGVPFRHIVRVGEPLDELVDVTCDEDPSWLVLCARRRSIWRRLGGAGLVEQLQARVRCPVVTYRELDEPAPLPMRPRRARGVRPPDELEALLEARTDALVGWLGLQRSAVDALARRRPVRHAVASLARGRRWSLDRSMLRTIEAGLRVELEEHRRAMGAIGIEVRSPYDTRPLLRLGDAARDDEGHRRWLDRLRRDGLGVSLPLEGEGSIDASTDTSCVIQAGAAIPLGGGGAPALLLVTLDARRDFLRILAQPGPTPSAETYAFDHQGLMLSYSRFPDQLRRVGLLPREPGLQTPRRLRVCDPGCNLVRGERSGDFPHPLTRAVAAATAGEDGCDWAGYRDYRGVAVVGAWKWIPEFGFGITAEMDASAASA